MIDELRGRASEMPVGTAEGLALDEQILRLAPDDTAAALRLGRGLQEVGRPAEALAVFEQLLERKPRHTIATRRADELRRSLAKMQEQTPAVKNAQRTGGPAERIVRRARKEWKCQGKGEPAAHSLRCARVIATGERYVEITWGEVSFHDSHRISLACASDLWGVDLADESA